MAMNKLSVFDLDVNPEMVVINMNYTGDDPIELEKQKHAKRVYHISRISAEAVLEFPELVPDRVKITSREIRKARRILEVYELFAVK